jgi:hypothetical protein
LTDTCLRGKDFYAICGDPSEKDANVREQREWGLAGVVGVVLSLGLWEVFPDLLGNAKLVTFYGACR